MKFLSGLILIIGSQFSNAALVDMDWNTSGDAALMLDTSSGLHWLDLSVTANQSYDFVNTQFQQGGAYEGFRYATQTEVLALWAEAGISNTGFNWIENAEWQQIKNLADRLGTSTLFYSEGIATHALGLVEGGLPLSSNQRWVMELTYHPDGLQVRTSSENYILDTNFASVHYSSYLVQAVPLPPSILLFASGFLGLVGFRGFCKINFKRI